MRHKKVATVKPIYRQSKPDSVYHSVLVTKLINYCMNNGQKTIAERIVYKAFDIIGEQTKTDPLEFFKTSLENIKPEMEVRSRRVGGANYQVPTAVRPERKQSLSLRWLVESATNRPNKTYHTFAEKLAAEILEAHENQGNAIKKKLETHKMAEANKAFSHFRW